MIWKEINSMDSIQDIFASNAIHILFKHSTRCPVSAMAKRNLEHDKVLIPKDTIIHYLDLIAYREISNTIEQLWGVKHESPQLIVVQGHNCLYNASHSDIDMQDIIPFIS
ncbi:bacillithiol system redox-active protein YtxJ [Sphingobacterium faecale]|uniref:Bacillithiol system redox-active protein YtxJ n=1 Tax=Sphingobacterium faecale TaxID=2803775 RepID=A0ABS1R5V4_9SPHI|nr:bacillithiol system redox-active protein YtxJ [Sphingobacterium faecale]MBL1409675.1 bacillithiol system redox-active protein YtxJ [Sphingobacterium faecale]